MSDDTTIYVAEKVPYTESAKEAFDTLDEAVQFLEQKISEEPAIDEFECVKPEFSFSDYMFEVREGRGTVAGHITEIPYHG